MYKYHFFNILFFKKNPGWLGYEVEPQKGSGIVTLSYPTEP